MICNKPINQLKTEKHKLINYCDLIEFSCKPQTAIFPSTVSELILLSILRQADVCFWFSTLSDDVISVRLETSGSGSSM